MEGLECQSEIHGPIFCVQQHSMSSCGEKIPRTQTLCGRLNGIWKAWVRHIPEGQKADYSFQETLNYSQEIIFLERIQRGLSRHRYDHRIDKNTKLLAYFLGGLHRL